MVLFDGAEAYQWQRFIEKFLIKQPTEFNSRSSQVELTSEDLLSFLDQLRVTYGDWIKL